MLTPFWCSIMLWIISVSNTVLPTPAPPNRPRFAAALERHQHIDGLDPRLEDLGFGGTPRQRWRGSMDGAPLDIRRRRLAVDGVPENVEHARENPFADRRLQLPARIFHGVAAGQTFGGGQCDSTHAMRVELSQHLDGDFPFLRVQQRVDGRQMLIEPYIHDAAAHRDHRAEVRRSGSVLLFIWSFSLRGPPETNGSTSSSFR